MGAAGDPPALNRWLAEASDRSATYDQRWAQMARDGEPVHGEADLIESLLSEAGRRTGGPPGAGSEAASRGAASVLDAGCGTGRVAVELSRRGVDVVGVDLDGAMLDKARAKAPGLAWVGADLASVDLGRDFDLVALAGNVMIFLTAGSEATVIANLARHLRPAGMFVAGFALQAGRLDLATYDRLARGVGLELAQRWSTWERQAFTGGDYAVSVHRLTAS